ncbi:MAG: SRPBCC family protein [Planctomycetota bacterium]|nr:SRPBCC family protein [Planctomycetota bacterium]
MKVTCDTQIDVTPEQLWPWLTEPEKQKVWMVGVESNELVEGDGHSVGSKFQMKIKEGGRLSDYDGTVVEYDRPKRLGVEMVGGCGKKPMTMRATYALESTPGGGTRLAYEGGGEVPGVFMKFMMVFFFWMPKLMIKKFMKRLKQAAEAEAQAA